MTVDAEIAAQIREIAKEDSVSSVVEQALREMLDRWHNARARLRKMALDGAKRDPEAAAQGEAAAERAFELWREMNSGRK